MKKYLSCSLTSVLSLVMVASVAQAQTATPPVVQLSQKVNSIAAAQQATTGGAPGQVLTKKSSNDYDFSWTTPTATAAATVDRLTTPRTIGITGDVTSSVSFDGSANVSSLATLTNVNSNVGTFGSASAIPVITADSKGRITSISTVAANATSSGGGVSQFKNLSDVTGLTTTANSIQLFGITTNASNVITGLQYNTTTAFSNGASNAGNLIRLNTNGLLDSTLFPTTIVSNTTGSAARLATSRTLTTVGDVTSSLSFDGSANASATATLSTVNSTVGTFGSSSYTPVITVDNKGRVTNISTVITSGGGGGGGAVSNGLPSGGMIGQILKKNSNADYDTSWLSLGSAGLASTGTSGATLGYLNGANIWSGIQTHTAPILTAPATTAGAGINIPTATAAPLSPNKGDIWSGNGAIVNYYDGAATRNFAFLDSNITGNAASATIANKLTTPRIIANTGDVTSSASFDGSTNISSATTLATVNANVGTYGSATAIPVITVNAKGLVTAVTTTTAATGSGASSGGVNSANVQVFNYTGASQTWNKPAGAKAVYVWAVAGGNGGGGGGDNNSGGGGGGNGGAGGGVNEATIPAVVLSDTVTISVGNGGAGGSFSRNSSYTGFVGENGGLSSFGTYLTAFAGAGYTPSISNIQAGGSGGIASNNCSTGGQSIGAAGGGGGGGTTGSGQGYAGCAGGIGSVKRGILVSAAGGGAPPYSYSGNNGDSGVANVGINETNAGGGGGGGSGTANSGGAGRGGNGATPGGGGGGGGGGYLAAGGTGGNGAPGRVVVITYF